MAILQAAGSNFEEVEQSSRTHSASQADLLEILMKEHKDVHELFLKMDRIGRSGVQQGPELEALMAKLKFDLSTGQAENGDCALLTYPARLSDTGQIMVDLRKTP